MYNFERTRKDDTRFLTPSFSSTLLDQIYRSIDDGERKTPDANFYRDTKKQSIRTNAKPTETERKLLLGTKTDRKSQQYRHHFIDHDQDAHFFSSTSVSSDSSSGGFSSSDTESLSRATSRFASVRASASFRSEKHGTRVFNGFFRTTEEEEHVTARDEEALIKSKSRARKIYNNLKKVKQPISPGNRVTSFLNSLFTNTKKTTNNNRTCEEVKSVRASSSYSSSSTCSSATSFSRSCLSKTSSSERERMRNGVKRTVRFYPVSVILGEDSRPCGHKRLCEEKIGKSFSMRKGEEASREFLKEYCNGQRKMNNSLVLKDLRRTVNYDEDDNDDDDASSYASSDLFELDHLAVFGSSRYSEELPVYETTHVSTNRAIAMAL